MMASPKRGAASSRTRGDVADAQRRAVRRRDHRLRQRLERGARRLRLQHDALGGGLQIAAADQLRAAAHRLIDIIERDAGAPAA